MKSYLVLYFCRSFFSLNGSTSFSYSIEAGTISIPWAS